MKYLVFLPDGAADEPCPELGGNTPLQAAHLPNMDWVAANGLCGVARTAPEGMYPGSDVCTMSLFGYAPADYYTGRAPIEAAAQGLDVGPNDVVLRCNLVTVIAGVMQDFSAGHISTAEATQLIAAIHRQLGGDDRQFFPGISYRHLMVDRTGQDLTFKATPPHDIQGQAIEPHLPTGPGSEQVRELMHRSREVLAEHEINRARLDRGELAATQIWLWGQGKTPALPRFADVFGVRGACITEVDLIRGLAQLVGWDLLHVDGLTGFTDTNYAGMGQAAAEALDQYDLVCVHIEAADECGHIGDARQKTEALANMDRLVLGPALDKLRTFPSWRVLIAPDHPTPCRYRTHTTEWPCFALAGSGIEPGSAQAFDELSARQTAVRVDPASRLMPMMLGQ